MTSTANNIAAAFIANGSAIAPCKSILFALVLFICPTAQAKTDIRVLLLENRREIFLSFHAPVIVRNTVTGNMLWEGQPEEVTVASVGEQIRMGGKIFNHRAVTVESEAPMAVAGRHYRGVFLIRNRDGEKLTLVNVLDVEEYLRGTMKSEISPLWPEPVLKVQAVVARSYAVYRRKMVREKTGRYYDLTAGVLSQVYIGVAGEHGLSDRAVAATAGEILLDHKGAVLETLYHACCGGTTESAKEVWGGDSDLQSVADPYCTASPHYNWQATVSIGDFINIWFNRGGPDQPLSLEPARKSSSGRWQDIRLRSGERVKVVRGVDFRRKMGVNTIRSTLFEVKVGKKELIFNGKGWGHGVGLCQWGARGMTGSTYKEILNYYYPLSHPGSYR